MMKKFIFVLILLFSFSSVSALEKCTPSKEYLEYEKLSDEEKKNRLEPIYCSEILDDKLSLSGITLNTVNEMFPILSSSINGSYYNAVEDGLVNPSENQRNTGLCWDFAALSTVESNAKKNQVGNYNFSEAHLAYSILGRLYRDDLGKSTRYNVGTDGGKITFAPTYFFNGYGQKLESEFSFNSRLVHVDSNNDTFSSILASEYQYGDNLISMENFYLDNVSETISKCSLYEITNIKDKILKYGAVQATMFMEESLFSDSGSNYYLSKATYPNSAKNHSVSIVGWDDNISKSRFNGATRDGAWIVKNSWGSTWSGDGLFYVSYDDEFICRMIASYAGVSSKSFANTYASSEVVGTFTHNISGTVWMATKFTKKTAALEKLERVSFPVGENSSYEVYLSLDGTFNSLQLLTRGYSDTYGIESVNLAGIDIENNFAIVIKYIVDSGNITSVFSTCNNASDVSHIPISLNTNFYSLNGSSWVDFGEDGCEFNIYAYTNPVRNDTYLEVNSISNIDDIISIKLSRNNINTDNIIYTVKDSGGHSVNDNFTLIPNYDNNEVYIISDNTISGTFTVNIKYGDININRTFKLEENISSRSENLDVSSNTITVIIGKGELLDYQKLLSYMNVENTTIVVDNQNGVNVTQNNSPIGTGYTVNTNNNLYRVVVKGDANGDGKISALDYIAIRKHMIKSNQSDLITDAIVKSAVDMNNDGKISALDYIAVRKIMIGG